MRPRQAHWFVIAVAGLVLRPLSASVVTVDFETTPALPAQPNNFAAATVHTVNVPGIATVSGGSVLGNPTFLTAFPTHGTPPNAYGTADFAAGLASTVGVDFSPSINVTGVTGVLFNGDTVAESYTVRVYDGPSVVGSINLLNVQPDSSADGWGGFAFSGFANLTKLEVVPQNTTSWDYFVDTIQITFNPAVPEPTSLLYLTAMSLVVVRRRRARLGR